MQMHGLANLSGWRWIFIIEGTLTVLVGVIGGYLLVDFPDKVKPGTFLSQVQLDWVTRRLQSDHGAAPTEKFAWSKFLGAAGSLPIWLYGMIAWYVSSLCQAYHLRFAVVLLLCPIVLPFSCRSFYATTWAFQLAKPNVLLHLHISSQQF